MTATQTKTATAAPPDLDSELAALERQRLEWEARKLAAERQADQAELAKLKGDWPELEKLTAAAKADKQDQQRALQAEIANSPQKRLEALEYELKYWSSFGGKKLANTQKLIAELEEKLRGTA